MDKVSDVPIIQVKLVRPVVGAGQAQMTTWLDYDKRLKQGVVITLKKDNKRWMVEEIYPETIKGAKDFDWHRKWDNNI